MPKGVTVDGRFPVPLRRTAPAEAAMLKELESLKGTYGAINERMREWLLRGIKELDQRTQQAPSAGGDAVSALAAAAAELNNSVAISQHFLSMYAQAKEVIAHATKSRLAPVREPVTPVVVPPSPDPEVTDPAPASPQVTRTAPPPHTWAHLKGLVGGDN